MKKSLSTWLSTLFGDDAANNAIAVDAPRIMPLGDSITQGNRRRNSYRRPLWHMLQEKGYEFRFVGSQRRNHWGGPSDKDFDRNHEGHWGWRADQILARLDKWTAAARPDIVLVHLGTNDISQGRSSHHVIRELIGIVHVLREHNPRVAILMAQLIGNALLGPRIEQLNAKILGIKDLASSRSPITIVDQWTGFEPSRHTYDGTHPNNAGELHMAESWFDALSSLLDQPIRMSGE